MIKPTEIRPLHMVRRIYDEQFKDHWKYDPFVDGEDYIFLGEIAQMPGHGVFVHMKTGQIYSGYHTDQFRESSGGETSVDITIPDEDEDREEVSQEEEESSNDRTTE